MTPDVSIVTDPSLFIAFQQHFESHAVTAVRVFVNNRVIVWVVAWIGVRWCPCLSGEDIVIHFIMGAFG